MSQLDNDISHQFNGQRFLYYLCTVRIKKIHLSTTLNKQFTRFKSQHPSYVAQTISRHNFCHYCTVEISISYSRLSHQCAISQSQKFRLFDLSFFFVEACGIKLSGIYKPNCINKKSSFQPLRNNFHSCFTSVLIWQ